MSVRTPFFAVRVEKQDITPWVSSVSVTEDDHEADNVSLSIPDPRMIYADAIFEGSEVEVDLGYDETDQHGLMIRAVLTKVELSYPGEGIPALKLKGEDKSIEMGLVERKKVWRDTTVTGIVTTIGHRYKFARVEANLQPDPDLRRKSEHQDGKTDLAFLHELAKKYHAKCFVELDEHGQEVLYFIPERRIVRLRRPDTMVLRYRMGPRSNLLSFSPSFDSSYMDRMKEVSDLDHHGKAIKTPDKAPSDPVIWELDQGRLAQASERDRCRVKALYQAGLEPKKELQKRLAARRVTVGEVASDQADLDSTADALEARRLGMKASGSTFGTIWLRAKSNVVIEGVNERFRGAWYVARVTHTVDHGGYKTDFNCVR